jgi:hypothetical protein
MERLQMQTMMEKTLRKAATIVTGHYLLCLMGWMPWFLNLRLLLGRGGHFVLLILFITVVELHGWRFKTSQSKLRVTKNTPMAELVAQAGLPDGKHPDARVTVKDMLVGGSGAASVMQGRVVEQETVRCRYIINCAGGASDQVAALIGDHSFKIKPRLGDYILLHRNQVSSCLCELE